MRCANLGYVLLLRPEDGTVAPGPLSTTSHTSLPPCRRAQGPPSTCVHRNCWSCDVCWLPTIYTWWYQAKYFEVRRQSWPLLGKSLASIEKSEPYKQNLMMDSNEGSGRPFRHICILPQESILPCWKWQNICKNLYFLWFLNLHFIIKFMLKHSLMND